MKTPSRTKKPASKNAATKKTSTKKAVSARRVPGRPFAIDFHAHFVVPEVAEFALPYRARAANSTLPADPRITEKQIAAAKEWGDGSRQRMIDYKLRLKTMDKAGVDIQVLTPSIIVQYTNWADPEASLKMERISNDRLAEIVDTAPDRFVGIGSVPIQSPELAVPELRRCMGELGLKGVQLAGVAGDMELGDPRLRPFWAEAEKLGAAIYIHPAGVDNPRYQKHQLWNSVGQPLEEAMAMMSLIYEGVLDDYPKLKVGIAHGGGFLPYYAGRVDRNYHDKPFLRLGMKRSPSGYFKRSFFYDTCVYDPVALDVLIAKVGAERIVMGSDYPVGEKDPVGFVMASKLLSKADKEAILSKNAAKILGLKL